MIIQEQLRDVTELAKVCFHWVRILQVTHVQMQMQISCSDWLQMNEQECVTFVINSGILS